MSVKAILGPLPREGFWAIAPALPGCSARGRTKDETLERLADALIAGVETYRLAGQSIPWQPEPADTPAGAEVHEVPPFWDDPYPPVDVEAMNQAHAAHERGESQSVDDILQEYGIDTPGDYRP